MTMQKKIAPRVLVAAVLASTTIPAVSGCGSGSGLFGEIHDISLEVTGEGGQARELYYGTGQGTTLRDVGLPWKMDNRQEFVPQLVRATPAPGRTVTCRIVVDGREVVTATSPAPDAPAECRKDKID